MIKAIYFDMGGVLLPLYPDRCKKAYRELAGFKDVDNFLDPCHQRGVFMRNELGEFDREGFIRECLRHCPPGTAPEIIPLCHKAFFGTPEPDTVALVKELAARYDIFLLSNNNALSMSLHIPNFEEAGLPLDTSFKKMFLSHEMHLLKPDPEIYRRAIEGSGYKAEECLFIDDSQSNVDGGIAAGMHAILFRPGTDNLRTLVTAALRELNG